MIPLLPQHPPPSLTPPPALHSPGTQELSMRDAVFIVSPKMENCMQG